MKSLKSQIAIEYTILIGMAIVGIMIFLIFIYSIQKEKSDEKLDIRMNDFAYYIQNEIILASEMNPGYVREIYIPPTVEGANFTFTNTDKSLQIIYMENYITLKIPTVTGTLVSGANILRKNTESEVHIN